MFKKIEHNLICKICSQLKPIEIKESLEFIACIGHIRKLIENDNFEKESSNFELDQYETEDGFWQDDFMYYSIRCKTCGRLYLCVCDTYHGNGKFV